MVRTLVGPGWVTIAILGLAMAAAFSAGATAGGHAARNEYVDAADVRRALDGAAAKAVMARELTASERLALRATGLTVDLLVELLYTYFRLGVAFGARHPALGIAWGAAFPYVTAGGIGWYLHRWLKRHARRWPPRI